MSFTAGEVMDSSAALLNDVAKQQYNYVAQLPFLKIALRQLKELFQLDNVPVTDEVSAQLTVIAGTTVISFTSIPALPSDLIEIRQLWERQSGVDPYIPMTKKDFLPHYLEGQDISSFLIWAWINQEIRLLAANRNNDLKIDYVKDLFTTVVDQNSTISVLNAQSYLEFQTAGLCAFHIGENESRANELYGGANEALERSLGISSKSRQAIATRRRPFRKSLKSRGF